MNQEHNKQNNMTDNEQENATFEDFKQLLVELGLVTESPEQTVEQREKAPDVNTMVAEIAKLDSKILKLEEEKKELKEALETLANYTGELEKRSLELILNLMDDELLEFAQEEFGGDEVAMKHLEGLLDFAKKELNESEDEDEEMELLEELEDEECDCKYCCPPAPDTEEDRMIDTLTLVYTKWYTSKVNKEQVEEAILSILRS